MADVIFHSSGSTGAPKEIVRTEASLQNDARHLIETFPEVWVADPRMSRTDSLAVSGDKPLVVASVHSEHMFGALWRVRAPALAGLAVVPKTIISVEEIAECATKRRPLIFVTTPSFLEKAIDHPDFAGLRGAFRAIITSGGPLRRETALAVQRAAGVCPLEIYGSTEAGTVAWRRQCDGEAFSLIPGVAATLDSLGAAAANGLEADSRNGRLVVDSPFAQMRPLAMGDLAEPVDARHFILKGRADRLVKILERPVSLSAVEKALVEHPFVARARVEAYGDAVPRLGALTVLSAEGLALAVREGSSAVASALRVGLRATLDDIAVPRRFRIVREFPANAQGKTTAVSVRAALGAWCREPIVTSWKATADRLEAELAFPSDMECFQGHFPGFPILPGVAQLYFLRHFARQVFPDWPDAATWRKLKFQKIIRPGMSARLSVLRNHGTGFRFELATPAGRCTSGLVEFTGRCECE